FSETAGAIAGLDVVISGDTSAALLACALGKPIWVLLPQVPDWRWLIGREDNAWYARMRVFRPRDGEASSEVMARIATALAAVAAGASAELAPHRARGEQRAAMAADIISLELAEG